MSYQIEKLPGSALLAFPEMAGLLLSELQGRFNFRAPDQPPAGEPRPFKPGQTQWAGDILYAPGLAVPPAPYWARTALPHPLLIRFDSMGDAAKALTSLQRSWAPYRYQIFRRGEIIQEKLPYVNLKVRPFPCEIPRAPIGLYTLVDEHTLLAGGETTSDLPAGTIEFAEDHKNPPSRAYLKLQESLTLAHHFFGVPYPHEGQRCFDAGACPGGWTWVLRKLGADIFAVDRTEIDPRLLHDRHVTFRAHDAFTLPPAKTGPFDWVVSDVICYPDRLLPWIKSWLEGGHTRNMICTIKLQGEFDWPLIAEFAAIPDSRVVHLNYNKHELTFLHAVPEA